jgi:pyruvate dehydrogenase E2 component (dihydrolipoamide acetyltransferase)
MAAELKVPTLGMDMEEATIVRWLVEEGTEVEKGEPVLEIDTDKTSFEIEAPSGGTIHGLRGEAGETIPVGATLAYIGSPGEEIREVENENTASVGDGGTPRTGEEGVLPAGGAVRKTTAEVEPEAPDHRNGRRRMRASPAARKAAAELGLPLEAVTGSGPHGRVYLSDVLQASVQPQAPAEEEARPQRDGADDRLRVSVETQAPPAEETLPEHSHREPLSRPRRIGAERTARSFSEVPHFYLTRDLEVDRLLELHERLKGRMEPPPTITDLLALAISRILRDHPHLNARYAGDELEFNSRVNLGIAVTTGRGLIVPVLKEADKLRLREMIPRFRDLVRKAREGKLQLDELSGGTFTLSNLGMMGIDSFDAIINTPEAAILAVGRVRTVPEWREGAWVPRRIISATLSVDHRVADGADGARFLQALQEALIDWELLL